jgi:hypothetical protein
MHSGSISKHRDNRYPYQVSIAAAASIPTTDFCANFLITSPCFDTCHCSMHLLDSSVEKSVFGYRSDCCLLSSIYVR